MATIVGTSGNDNLTSTAADDSIQGLGGNDTIYFPGSSHGDDVVDGGSGSDTIDFRTSGAAGIVADYRSGTIVSAAGTVSFSSVERVVGTHANDHLIGGTGNQNLSAAGGDDELEGGAGNDWLWGGGGADTFAFRETGTANADNIGDFSGAADKIVLDATVMTALGAEGQFATGDARFVASASGTAQDSSDRVIYNTTTRQLFYDADGNGAGAAQLIATLQSGATLTATNIVVEGGGTPPPGGATEGDDVLVGTEGADTIDGLGGNDQISGLGGNDHLIGGSGNDTLDGGPGVDMLEGGTGNDTYIALGDGDTLSDSGGIDTVIVTENDVSIWTLADGYENLIMRGSSSAFVVGNGNDLDNVITNEHHNFDGVLDGGHGNDTLIGGPYFEFILGGGDYGHDFVDGAGDNGRLLVGHFSAVVVDFRNGTVVGGGEGGTGQIDFVNIGSVRGGDFADQFYASDTGSTALGGAGDDLFVGGAGADDFSDDWPGFNYDGTIPAGADIGHDQISGGGGNDFLEISLGNDTVDAGAGDDVVQIQTMHNLLEYDYGNDAIDGGTGIDTLSMTPLSGVSVDLGVGTLTGGGAGGSGFAALAGMENFVTIDLGDFAHEVTGSASANVLGLRSGDGVINGAGGNDTLTGGPGVTRFIFDQAAGAANADMVTDFEVGRDELVLDPAPMPALGTPGPLSSGDERFHAAPGATGGAEADDRIVYNTTSGQLFYDADGSGSGMAQLIATLQGAPTLSATDIVIVGEAGPGGEHIVGTSGNDTLTGTAGDDTIEGLGGADTIAGQAGNDSLLGGDGNDWFNMNAGYGNDLVDGGSGSDTLDFRPSGAPGIVADYGTGTIVSAMGTTSFANVERVVGTHANDHLTGSAGAQNLSGVGGNDILEGRTGNDWLWGGAGNDTFVFRENGSANADRIGDFAVNFDTIALDNAAMAALGANGDFAAGDARFRAAAGATGGADANDRVIYNTTTGQLYYDADGSGAGASQLIATLSGAPGVTATDISVI